jgi:hypothetical protein
VKLPSSFDHAGHKSQDTSDLLSSTPCDWSTFLPFTFINERWFYPLKLNNWKKWPQTNCYHEAMHFPQGLERHLMHYPIRSQKLKIRVYVFLSHDTFYQISKIYIFMEIKHAFIESKTRYQKIYLILVYLLWTFSIEFLTFSELLAADVSKNKNSWSIGVLPIEYG